MANPTFTDIYYHDIDNSAKIVNESLRGVE